MRLSEVRLTEFPDYGIDENGSITSYKREPPINMTPKKNKDGYLVVGLRVNNKKYFRFVHRLVAQSFITNPLSKEQVNHKDGNILNNCVSNLEWCTLQENIAHSFHVLGRKGQHTTSRKCKLFKCNEFVGCFDNIKTACEYAADAFGASFSGLNRNLKSKDFEILRVE